MSRGSTLRAVSALVGALIAVVALALLGLLAYSSARARHLTAERYRRLASIAVQLDETADALQEAWRSAGGGETGCPRGFDCRSAASAPGEGVFVRRNPPTLVVTAGPPSGKGGATQTEAAEALWSFVNQVLSTHELSGQVLLTTRSGEVLYHGRENRRYYIRDVADLLPSGAGPDGGKPGAPARDGAGWSIFDFAGREDLSYAGMPHRLYVVSISLRVLESSTEGAAVTSEGLYLCNLVPVSSLRADQMDVSPLWIVALAFTLVLVLLAWPVLKLRFMGPRDRLRGTEVRMLVLAALLGSGIATFALGAWSTHLQIMTAFDEDMEQLALLVERRFGDDVHDAFGVLRQVAETGRPPAASFHAFTDLLIVDVDGKPRARWEPRSKVRGGRVYWRIRPGRIPPKLDVHDRSYFKAVHRGRFWALERGRDEPLRPAGIALEAVRSRRTAQFVLVIATPMRRTPAGDGAQVVLGSTMPSFEHPLLPRGLAFAIVDRDGGVQLHSVTKKNLNENLLDDCDDDLTLRALLQERRQMHFHARCLAGDERLFVKPLAGTPWSVVVMRGERIWEETVAELALVWMTLYGGYLLAWLALLLVVLVVDDGYQAAWLWPRRELAADYLQATALLGGTALFFWCAAATMDGGARAALVGLLPALAIAFLAHRLDRRGVLGRRERLLFRAVLVGGCGAFAFLAVRWEAWWLLSGGAALGALWLLAAHGGSLLPKRCRPRVEAGETGFRTSYAAMLTALLATVAVVPAAVLFRDARQYVLTAFVKLGHRELAEDFEVRAERIWEENSVVDRAATLRGRAREQQVRAAIARGRIADSRDVYAPSWLAWATPWLQPAHGTVPYCAIGGDPCPPADVVPDLVSHWTLPLLPPLTKFTAEIRQATCAGASDATWCWRRTADGGLRLDPDPGRPGRLARPRRSGWTATLPWPGTLMLVAAWTALVLTAFGLVWMLARMVFLLDADVGTPTCSDAAGADVETVFESPAPPPAPGDATPTLDAPPSGDAAKAAAIDLRSVESDRIAWIAGRNDVERAERLTLRHLEAVLDDPERSDATLLLVRTLARRKRSLTLTSIVDPVRRLCELAEEAASAEPARHAAADRRLAAWAEVLAGFRKHERRTRRPASDPEEQGDHARAGRNAILWTSSTPAQRLAMRQLAEEGYLNPGAVEVARELLRTGRVRRAPTFALHDSSFRRFVLAAVPAARLEEWEREGGPSAWSRLQLPLLVLIVGLAAVVFVLQPQMLQSALGVATGVSAAVPILMRMFSALGNQGGARTS